MCCNRKFFHVFLIAFACFFAHESWGQLLVGPKFGAQMGWISIQQDQDKEFLQSEMVPGFHAGGAAIWRVRDRFYLHTELLYAMNRQKITGKFDELLESNITNQMIELPVSFKVNFDTRIKNLKYQVYLGAGPNVKYWISGKSEVYSSEIDEVGVGTRNYTIEFEEYPEGLDDNIDNSLLYIEDANRIQLGVNAVAGLMFQPQSGHTIILDIRFDYGHSYLSRHDYGIYPDLIDYAEPIRSRYHAIKIGLAYLIDTNVASRNKGKSTANPKKRR